MEKSECKIESWITVADGSAADVVRVIGIDSNYCIVLRPENPNIFKSSSGEPLSEEKAKLCGVDSKYIGQKIWYFKFTNCEPFKKKKCEDCCAVLQFQD